MVKSTDVKKITDSLHYDVILNIFHRVKSGDLPIKSLEEPLKILFLIRNKAFLLFNNLKPLQSASSELERLQKLLEEYSLIVDNISLSFNKSELEEFFSGLEELKKILHEIFQVSCVMAQKEVKIPGKDLTLSPVINEFLAVAYYVLQEGKGEEALKEKLSFLRKFIAATAEQIDYMVPAPDTVVVQREFPVILNSLEEMEKALENILPYFEDHNKKHIVFAIEIIKKSTETLIMSKDKIKKSFFALFHRFCLRCGYDNDIILNICENCNEWLQDFARDDHMKDFDLKREEYDRCFPRGLLLDTTILDIIYKGELFYFESIGASEFEEHLMNFQNKIGNFEKIFLSVKKPQKKENSRDYFIFNEIYSRIELCINELKDGMRLFRRYIVSLKKEDFLEGAKKLTLTGGFLHELLDLCEICERRLSKIRGKKCREIK